MNSVTVALSGGFRVDGTWCREVRLRELTGEEQAYLIDEAGKLPPVCWTTEVLNRCAYRTDNDEPLTADCLRSLTVGDREALLLQLRRLTFGDRLQCVLECPASDCGAKLDLELRVTELLIPAGECRPEVHD